MHLITSFYVIGKRSEPSVGRWAGNFELLHMPVCSVCVCVPYGHNPESFTGFTYKINKRKWSSWKILHGYDRFVNDEVNDCGFDGQWKETWIYM